VIVHSLVSIIKERSEFSQKAQLLALNYGCADRGLKRDYSGSRKPISKIRFPLTQRINIDPSSQRCVLAERLSFNTYFENDLSGIEVKSGNESDS
jgi:hypothetical protein